MVDVKTKCLYNAIPYLGHINDNANPGVSVPGRVVLKLTEPWRLFSTINGQLFHLPWISSQTSQKKDNFAGYYKAQPTRNSTNCKVKA